MKKLFAILLVIAMMVTLTACGSGGKNDSDDKSSNAQTESSLNGDEQNGGSENSDESGANGENDGADNQTNTGANGENGENATTNDGANTGVNGENAESGGANADADNGTADKNQGNNSSANSDKNQNNNSSATGDKNQGNDSDSANGKPSGSTDANHKHSYTAKVTKAATCGAKGVQTFTCSCGNKYTKDIAATGKHSWGDWKTTKEPTETTKGSAQRTCKTCSKVEVKNLDKLSNRFINTTVDGRWNKDTISVLPKEVYFENGKLVAHCYIVNGFSTTATNVGITEIYIKDKDGKEIAHASFKAQNLTINAISYVEHTFTFAADTVSSPDAKLSYLNLSARYTAKH